MAKLCDFFAERGTRALIVLPPETLRDGLYRPHMRHTRERTAMFNRIWREAIGQRSGIDFVDLSELAEESEVSDVSHYHPALLRKLAARVDDWYRAEAQPKLSQAA